MNGELSKENRKMGIGGPRLLAFDPGFCLVACIVHKAEKKKKKRIIFI
jgi:hypothetical protein